MSFKEKPHFEGKPGLINKPDGSAMFECICVGNPQPEFKWFHKDKEIANDDRHKMTAKKTVGKYNLTLTIKSPSHADQGVYKVVAKNDSGSAEVEQNYVMKQTADSVYKMEDKYT